jgi:hypothetical protein
MSPADPIYTDTVAGATKGLLSWTKEEILVWVKKLWNRDLAFIEDPETIDLVKSQRQSPEWEILSKYVIDKKLRIIVQMGLTLRKLEDDMERVTRVRNSILRVFATEGLHIAEAVQNGVLSAFIGIDSRLTETPADLTNRIEKMLGEVDKYIVFISMDDIVDQKVKEIGTRLDANVPDTLILYGCRAGAIRKVRSIATKLKRYYGGRYRFTANESDIKIIVVITKWTSLTDRRVEIEKLAC